MNREIVFLSANIISRGQLETPDVQTELSTRRQVSVSFESLLVWSAGKGIMKK